jgi:hypothetical protein
LLFPATFRDLIVNELDSYLEAFGSDPDAEVVAGYVVELIEVWADEEGVDDVISELEDSGSLEDTFPETLETEMSSNDEFEYTGEEIASLIERMCGIEWGEGEGEEDDETDPGTEELDED